MIYEKPNVGDEIRQGDIFRNVPVPEFDADQILLYEDSGSLIRESWIDIVEDNSTAEGITALVALRRATCIVITQDCDAIRSPYISLCEVLPFGDVEARARTASRPKAFMSIITQHARLNQKWFYLPIDPSIGLHEKMCADLRRVTRLSLDSLELLKPTHRVGRLNEVALAHLRERISEFFRRYPYDEWYPLDREELEAYSQSKSEEIEPYPWQT